VHFSECVRAGKEPRPSGREGLADVRVIEALYRSAEASAYDQPRLSIASVYSWRPEGSGSRRRTSRYACRTICSARHPFATERLATG